MKLKPRIDLPLKILIISEILDYFSTFLFLYLDLAEEGNPFMAFLLGISPFLVLLDTVIIVIVISLMNDTLRKTFAYALSFGHFLAAAFNFMLVISGDTLFGVIIDYHGLVALSLAVGVGTFIYTSHKKRPKRKELIKNILIAVAFTLALVLPAWLV